MLDLAGRMTFEGCVVDDRCSRDLKLEWWGSKMTAMLCGFAPMCTVMDRALSRDAIELAKHNLEHQVGGEERGEDHAQPHSPLPSPPLPCLPLPSQITAFGLLNDRATFLTLLSARLPTFFENANTTDPVISPDISLLNHGSDVSGSPKSTSEWKQTLALGSQARSQPKINI